MIPITPQNTSFPALAIDAKGFNPSGTTERAQLPFLKEASGFLNHSESEGCLMPMVPFEWSGKVYVKRATLGEGSCALHALLGEEIGGEFCYKKDKDSSETVKMVYLSALFHALSENKAAVVDRFLSVISNYFTEGMKKPVVDAKAEMLFKQAAGKDLLDDYRSIHFRSLENIESLESEEAALWQAILFASEGDFKGLFRASLEKNNPSFTIKCFDEILSDPKKILNVIEERPEHFLNLLDETERQSIKRCREARAHAYKTRKNEMESFIRKDEMKSFILSPAFLEWYQKIFLDKEFYLNIHELQLAAFLFNKKMLVVSFREGSILPATDMINKELADEPIIIFHEGVHFSRCTPWVLDPSAKRINDSALTTLSSSPQAIKSPVSEGLEPGGDSTDLVLLMEKIEASLDPSFLTLVRPPPGDRETRKGVFVLEEMRVEAFNPETMEMTLAFTSKEGLHDFYRQSASSLSSMGYFAFAKAHANKLGGVSDIESMRWTARAIKATADQMQKEGEEITAAQHKGKTLSAAEIKKGEKAASYGEMKAHSEAVAASCESKEQRFAELVKRIREKITSSEKGLYELLDNFFEAISLSSHVFEPHYFTLLLNRTLAFYNPSQALYLANLAYECSPIQTFNVMMTWATIGFSGADEKAKQHFLAHIELLLTRFPGDVVVHMLITALTEIGILKKEGSEEQDRLYRETFSKNLERAFSLVKNHNYEEAREAFVNAGFYNISDPRSYRYIALIDLLDSDTDSAVLQTVRMQQTVNWLDVEARNLFVKWVAEKIWGGKNGKVHSADSKETAILKALIKLIRLEKATDEAREAFVSHFITYLQDSAKVDLLWAFLVMEVVEKKLYFDQATLRLLHLNLACSSYNVLRESSADTSSYDDIIEIDEEKDRFTYTVLIKLEKAIQKDKNLAINPANFRLFAQANIDLAHSILEKSYEKMVLSYLSISENLEGVFKVLKDFSLSDKHQLNSRLFVKLFEELDKSGSQFQKEILIHFLLKHKEPMNNSLQRAFYHFYHRWQLKTLLSQGIEFSLAASEKEAVEIMKKAKDLRKDQTILAYNAWCLLKAQKWDEAQTLISPFFSRWEENLDKAIDVEALKILCLVQALLKQKEIAKNIPSRPRSILHSELIMQAFSLLAREGILAPFVFPATPLSKEEKEKLFQHYLGPKRGEKIEDYLKRLKKSRVRPIDDLREVKHVHSILEPEPKSKIWVFSTRDTSVITDVSTLLEDGIKQVQSRIEHDLQISQEKPQEGTDEALAAWIVDKTDIVQLYMKDKAALIAEINRRFPSLSKSSKDKLLAELEAKKAHQEEYEQLKRKTPKASKIPAERFWQLVEITTQLIETVHTYTHTAGCYNLALENEEEAYFVMQLIREWSLSKWKGGVEEFNAAFHGPEIHIFNDAPRIPHFNAGVYKPSRSKDKEANLENTHLYFKPS